MRVDGWVGWWECNLVGGWMVGLADESPQKSSLDLV